MTHGSRLQRRCRVSRAATGGFKVGIPSEIKQDIKDIHNRRDNWHGVVALLVDWMVIAGTVVLVVSFDFQLLSYLGAVVVIGSRQRALRSLMHEASHLKLTRSRSLNIWLGRLLIAFPLFSGLSGYIVRPL